MIHAPYNFVPLNKEVVIPDWADKISHDIPFSDGICGSFTITITAMSPIFVRNGHTSDDKKNKTDEYTSFANIGDLFYIPATSIKGSIRNVLEIMSFGKLSRVGKQRYAMRDLNNTEYRNHFDDIHCGWMTLKDGQVTITDNGVPRRISHAAIDKILGTNFVYKFSNPTLLKDDENRSPLYKIGLLQDKPTHHKFKELPKNSKDTRIKVSFSNDHDAFWGEIVVTGQASARKQDYNGRASGKFYEFVFLDKEERKPYTLNETDNLYQDFRFIYKDTPEWKHWEKKLKNGERVPVFFCAKKGELQHFGLSYLYKLPFDKRLNEYVGDKHLIKECYDLAECIFGSTEGKNPLRGRVQFSHAFCTSSHEPETEVVDPYMASPKPTFYPAYINQDNRKKDNKGNLLYNTMLDKSATLRGWKRYPVQKTHQTEFAIPTGQGDNTSPFYPMPAGSTFKCVVRFHNLRPEELGALLYAIQMEEGYMHSIGTAKPFGYGKIRLDISECVGFDDIKSLQQTFERYMCDYIKDYKKTPQIRELKAMMREQDVMNIYQLMYMDLSEFVKCKKAKDVLPPFTETIQRNNNTQPTAPEKDKVVEAVVCVLQGSLKQAKYNGKNYPLEVGITRERLRIGDKIKAKANEKNGKIKSLTFISKI